MSGRGRAPPLHLPGRGAGLGQGLADHPLAVAVRTATRASAGAVSSAKPPVPSGHRRRRRLARTRPSIAARRPPARGRARGCAVTAGRRPSAASRMVCQPVQRQRWASRAWSTAAARAVPAAADAARRTMMPGRAEPALAGPGRGERASPSARRPSRPSTVVTCRPATRRAGVTQATRAWPSTRTVQQPHWPCGLQPSLAERTPSRSRSASSNEHPSSGTSTARPSTTNAERPGTTVGRLRRDCRPAIGSGRRYPRNEARGPAGGRSCSARRPRLTLAACGDGGSDTVRSAAARVAATTTRPRPTTGCRSAAGRRPMTWC